MPAVGVSAPARADRGEAAARLDGRVKRPGVSIRLARPTDAWQLASLRWEFRSPRAPARESRAEFVRRARAWMAARLGRKGGWRCWVAVRHGVIVGHAWVHLIEKIPNPGDEPERHAYLTNMYVELGSRGGVGTALLAAALRWCDRQGVDETILWPTPMSRSLYRRHGFRGSRPMTRRSSHASEVPNRT